MTILYDIYDLYDSKSYKKKNIYLLKRCARVSIRHLNTLQKIFKTEKTLISRFPQSVMKIWN